MKLLAIIPARGGSKGIPRKNIKILCGKPLIEWTVAAAKKSRFIDRLVVSTEDEEIASIARSLGVDVPFLRPTELAQDETPGIDPVLHAISRLPHYDWVMLLQPTSPMRSVDDIDGVWAFCQEHRAPSSLSVSEVSKHPFLMYEKVEGHKLIPFIEGKEGIARRQDFPPAFAVNGAIYLARTDWLVAKNSFIGPETLGYEMPVERSLDVDTIQDWDLATILMKEKLQKDFLAKEISI